MHKMLFPSTSRAGGVHTSDPISTAGFLGGAVYIDYTAGTGSTVVKLQRYDGTGNKWHDLHGAVLGAVEAAGTTSMTIYPGVAETANLSVSDVVGDQVRAIATITTYPATFSVSMDLKN